MLLPRPHRRAAVALLSLLGPSTAHAADGWTKAPNSSVRLNWCGGPEGSTSKDAAELAFLEMRLDPGWKTYWRMPGDAGVPPSATWEKSKNLTATAFYFPAPTRLADQGGESIGYKDRMILPIRVTRTDPKSPVTLTTTFSYGICKNICVPVDIDLTAGCFDNGMTDEIARAVEAVPRAPGQRRGSDPNLVTISGTVTGATPRLTIEVDFPPGAANTDLFIEAPEGLFVPLPARVTPDAKGRARYTIDLSKVIEAKDLLGKTLRLTMTSAAGASEAEWVAK